MSKDETEEMANALHRFSEKWGPLLSGGNSSQSHVTVTSGTTTVVVCIVVAVASVFLSLSQAARIATLERKLDRIEDYQMTTYMLVPGLREQVEKAINARKEVGK